MGAANIHKPCTAAASAGPYPKGAQVVDARLRSVHRRTRNQRSDGGKWLAGSAGLSCAFLERQLLLGPSVMSAILSLWDGKRTCRTQRSRFMGAGSSGGNIIRLRWSFLRLRPARGSKSFGRWHDIFGCPVDLRISGHQRTGPSAPIISRQCRRA